MIPRITFAFIGFACLSAATSLATPTTTQPSSRAPWPPALQAKVDRAIAKSLARLAETQMDDGGWPGYEGKSDAAITCLVAKCFAQDPNYGPDHPVVRKALTRVLAAQQPDGGIYENPTIKNYSASVALMFFSALPEPQIRKAIAAQQKFLKDDQWQEGKTDDDGKPITRAHPWYGGAGYGHHKRPDLSNTQMMLEALHQSGLPKDDPVYRRALVFISRCQMCSDTNDMPFAKHGRDGGFIYTCADNGESKAGYIDEDGDRILRSYGSMTYAGFKSMLYANVDHNDHRVQLAWRWIRDHYTLDSNPNMPDGQSKEGLYYFYHVFAKALRAWGEPTVPAAAGPPHNWRVDLATKLLETQQPDGSWVNTADRWMEGNPDLVSAYAVLALQEAMRP